MKPAQYACISSGSQERLPALRDSGRATSIQRGTPSLLATRWLPYLLSSTAAMSAFSTLDGTLLARGPDAVVPARRLTSGRGMRALSA